MKESYVSYECARKLKECGFDWECDHYYESQKEFRESRVFPATFKISDFWHNFNEVDQQNRHNQPFYPEYSAPSLSLAQKWLRDEKGIFVGVAYDNNPLCSTPFGYEVKIPMCNDRNDFDFYSYEDALSAGIDRALTLF